MVKGKEPAGLRRWRLAQKNRNAGKKVKKIKRTVGAPHRKVRTMTRGRKGSRKGRSRGHKWSLPSIATGGWLLYTASKLGWIEAAQTLANGGSGSLSAAANVLVANATVDNFLPVIGSGVAISIARQAVGTVKLAQVGRFSIRAL